MSKASDQTTSAAKKVPMLTLRLLSPYCLQFSPVLQASSFSRMSSEHDQAVLNSIFNPYLPLGEGIDWAEPVLTNGHCDEDNSPSAVESKKLELEGVQRAEAGDLSEAIHLLTRALELTPNRPSLYNNRAQVYRLLRNDTEALADLSKAIRLSGGRGKVAIQALCQRGLLYRHRDEDSEARADFKAAADLGSDFAKQQLAQMNPYAAMCNQMLRQMFKKMKQPAEAV